MIKTLLRGTDKILSDLASTFISEKLNSSVTPRPDGTKQKFLVDCTYIYSTNVNTGIQRVVRNVLYHIEKYVEANNMELMCVALVNGTFIKIDKKQIEEYIPLSRPANILQRIKRKIALYKASFNQVERLYEDDILLMLDSSWYLNIWQSVAYAKEKGVSVIGVTYDLIPISHPQFCDDTLGKVFDEWYRLSMHYFDGYLSISETVMNILKSYLEKQSEDIHKYQFDYFTLGSDFEKASSDKIVPRDNLRTIYKANSSIYLTVSTIEPRKNHQFLFEVFKKLWAEGVDVSWVVVGRVGWKVNALLKDMKSHELYGKKMWILHDIDDEGLRYCYQHSKALLFPSIVEGYGLPIIESLNYGLPVLASDTPIHREVGGDNIDYFDIDDSNQLVGILSDIEDEKKELKYIVQENIVIPTWDESAKEVFEKTILLSLK